MCVRACVCALACLIYSMHLCQIILIVPCCDRELICHARQ